MSSALTILAVLFIAYVFVSVARPSKPKASPLKTKMKGCHCHSKTAAMFCSNKCTRLNHYGK